MSTDLMIYRYVYSCVTIFMYMYIYVYVYLCICIFTYVLYMCILCICIFRYIYVYMYMYIYMRALYKGYSRDILLPVLYKSRFRVRLSLLVNSPSTKHGSAWYELSSDILGLSYHIYITYICIFYIYPPLYRYIHNQSLSIYMCEGARSILIK